jgi:hypothetical protein
MRALLRGLITVAVFFIAPIYVSAAGAPLRPPPIPLQSDGEKANPPKDQPRTPHPITSRTNRASRAFRLVTHS